MPETYYIHNSMVVPVEGLDVLALRDILRKEHKRPFFEDDLPYRLDSFYSKLSEVLPEFLDKNNSYVGVMPSFYGEKAETRTNIMYTVPLQQGRVSARMTLAQDLRACIGKTDVDSLPDENKSFLLNAISGKSGIIVQGQYKHGTDHNQGLYLGVESDSLRQSQQDRLDNILSDVTQAVLNALCESKPLELGQEEMREYSPLDLQGREVRANVKDFQVDKLKEAEPHINEFFSWIASHSQEIQSVLVMSNAYGVVADVEEQLQELQQSRKIAITTMPNYTSHMLKIIDGLMTNLQPPKNRRMEYLVSE